MITLLNNLSNRDAMDMIILLTVTIAQVIITINVIKSK